MVPSHRLRVALLLLIALCGLFVYSYTVRQIERAKVEAEIDLVQAMIDDAKAEQAELEAELARLNSPDYLDRVAREQFDMAKPGDTVIVMVQPTPAPIAVANSALAPPANSQTARPASDLPIWRQWVVVFTTDSAPFP